MPTITSARTSQVLAHIREVDSYVSHRVRQRRLVLGITQSELGKMVGVAHQQIQKYEAGVDRIPANRLFDIARALGVDVGYFVEGLEGDDDARQKIPPQTTRLLLELAGNFAKIRKRKDKEAVCKLARKLARKEGDAVDGQMPHSSDVAC
jgi:transcriptional regulator with XRE-family HTH domain